MKTMLKFISLAAILAASAPLALATPINVAIGVNGSATTLTSTTLKLASPGNVGGIGAGAGSGADTSGFFHQCFGCATFNTNPLNFGSNGVDTVISGSATSGGLFIGSLDQNGELLSFYATDETPTYSAAHGLNIIGSGYFTEVCDAAICGSGNKDYTPTAATYIFNASSSGSFSTFQATSGTNAPIGGNSGAAPEPGSFALLGTGLLTAAGVARRKFKV